MKTFWLALLLLACGCAHVSQSLATFLRQGGPAGNGTLVLRIARHMDTILNGPDIEEDQVLLLTVRDPVINQKIVLPDPRVTARFSATRFGPPSRGDSFKGYLVITRITDTAVTAKMSVTLISRTSDDSYVHTERFHGAFHFLRGTAEEWQ